jgi:small-conductance mechanosensitive channel
MTLKFTLGFDSDLEHAKQIVLATIANVTGVETDPKANVYVTEFTADGAMLTVQFWIDTNENKPLKVFDSVSIEVLKALNAAGEKVNTKAKETVETEQVAEPTPSRGSRDDL